MFATNLYKLMVKPRVKYCTEIKMRVNGDKITDALETRIAVQNGRTRLAKSIKYIRQSDSTGNRAEELIYVAKYVTKI